ncbi:hypothetical protein [Petralouisia muris]|uniref:hypothetical protein n=1 Tax=Petralouisia muris TaxID=3032872 RepID=UPI0023B8047F|nr:hypothetical protein [Petralouisia muris]
MEAVEINHKAAEILRKDSFFEIPVKVHETSILEYEPAVPYDVVLIKYQDVKLLSYGFRYHLDSNFPMDDITWFLMEKE